MTTTTNTKTLLTIKTDKKLKLAAQQTVQRLGIPLSTFINMSLRRLVEKKEIHFVLPTYTASPALTRSLKQIEKEIARGDYRGEKPLSLKELAKEWGVKYE